MSTSYFYGRINDKGVLRVFMRRYMINEYLVFLWEDK
jgi:hypothetical protein